jgi:hypothetical protein
MESLSPCLLWPALAGYGCALLATMFNLNRRGVDWPMMVAALLCALAFVLRYAAAWPMMPMHLGLVGMAATLGLLACVGRLRAGETPQVRLEQGLTLATLILLLLAALLFPKDFYLPFVRSATPWAHLFLLFAILGKSLLLMAAVRALTLLLGKQARLTGQQLGSAMTVSLWGFALLTVSMFCGETWSYLGWGSPVVWQDPAIAAGMVLWFYWVCLLHLHHTRGWRPRHRAVFMVVGGVLVLGFGCHPDLGPFRGVLP